MRKLWLLLLVVPLVGALDVPLYARRTPELAGIPFFIWYQFVLVIVGAAVTGLVHYLTVTRAESTSEPTS